MKSICLLDGSLPRSVSSSWVPISREGGISSSRRYDRFLSVHTQFSTIWGGKKEQTSLKEMYYRATEPPKRSYSGCIINKYSLIKKKTHRGVAHLAVKVWGVDARFDDVEQGIDQTLTAAHLPACLLTGRAQVSAATCIPRNLISIFQPNNQVIQCIHKYIPRIWFLYVYAQTIPEWIRITKEMFLKSFKTIMGAKKNLITHWLGFSL